MQSVDSEVFWLNDLFDAKNQIVLEFKGGGVLFFLIHLKYFSFRLLVFFVPAFVAKLQLLLNIRTLT